MLPGMILGLLVLVVLLSLELLFQLMMVEIMMLGLLVPPGMQVMMIFCCLDWGPPYLLLLLFLPPIQLRDKVYTLQILFMLVQLVLLGMNDPFKHFPSFLRMNINIYKCWPGCQNGNSSETTNTLMELWVLFSLYVLLDIGSYRTIAGKKLSDRRGLLVNFTVQFPGTIMSLRLRLDQRPSRLPEAGPRPNLCHPST